ncbi:MAG: aromatic amino acid transport family protein [Waddliaceae bacterium]
MRNTNSLVGGILLVAGTSIGAGMLGLPVLTAQIGFLPTCLIYTIAWAIMASTGLLLLEVTLWFQARTNLVSMAKETLGFWGAAFAWVIYLFFFYFLTLAYITGCGKFLTFLSDGAIPEWLSPAIFVLLFSPFVIYGAHLLSQVNAVMVVGLIVSFVSFLVLGFSHIHLPILETADWSAAIFALPISFAAFGFQGVIPSLGHYFNYNRKKTQTAIVLGSLIPLVIYTIWEAFILGIVPLDGPNSLSEALIQGEEVVAPLAKQLKNSKVAYLAQVFGFFALSTSFFGVTLGLMDFLSDGLKIPKRGAYRLLLGALVFFPPVLVAMIDPRLFLTALGVAGGFGGALLLGLLPILMFFSGKYYLKLKTKLPVGKLGLFLITVIVFMVVVIEILHLV